MNDQQPRMLYTRLMAFTAFFYGLWYIETHYPIELPVLWFLGAVIGFWSLGRASFSEALQVFKEWLSRK